MSGITNAQICVLQGTTSCVSGFVRYLQKGLDTRTLVSEFRCLGLKIYVLFAAQN